MKTIKQQRGTAALVMVLAWATAASAGIGDKVSDQRFEVPGVVHTTYLATVFQCTSTDVTPASTAMTVEVYNNAGLLAGTAQVFLGGGQTGVISSGTVASLIPDATMGITPPLQGSARIMGGKKLVCAAYVMSPGSVPGYMNSLPVLTKLKQQGQ